MRTWIITVIALLVFDVAMLTGLLLLQSPTGSGASWEVRLCGGACALFW